MIRDMVSGADLALAHHDARHGPTTLLSRNAATVAAMISAASAGSERSRKMSTEDPSSTFYANVAVDRDRNRASWLIGHSRRAIQSVEFAE